MRRHLSILLMLVMIITGAVMIPSYAVEQSDSGEGENYVASQEPGSPDQDESRPDESGTYESGTDQDESGTAGEEDAAQPGGGTETEPAQEPEQEPETEPVCTEHVWSEWVTVPATYIADGSRTRTCEVCGETEVSMIPRLIVRSKWVTVGGSKYYLNASGSVVKGWQKIKSSNAKKAAKKWCYFNDAGVFCKSISAGTKNKWVTAGGRKFYFTKAKKPQTAGYHIIGSKLYCFNKDKSLYIGTVTIDGVDYKTGASGQLTGIPYYIYKYKTFVLVDISDQKLYFYKAGKSKLTANVITAGNRKGTSYTPTGTFKMIYRKKNISLNWAGRSWPVSYWIAFKGTLFGFHDARWRSDAEFNDPNTHIRNGSHGCVNMRKADIAKLYSQAPNGTRVIIRN